MPEIGSPRGGNPVQPCSRAAFRPTAVSESSCIRDFTLLNFLWVVVSFDAPTSSQVFSGPYNRSPNR